jgi:hypothetical protein
MMGCVVSGNGHRWLWCVMVTTSCNYWPKLLTLVREDEQDLWTAGVVLGHSEVIAILLARNQNF